MDAPLYEKHRVILSEREGKLDLVTADSAELDAAAALELAGVLQRWATRPVVVDPAGPRHTCPRRAEVGADSPAFRGGGTDLDYWRTEGGCSYCGSMKPEELLELAEGGVQLVPTDKNYKLYVGARGKFYFQHFSVEQQKRFIELLNAGKLKLGMPGHFYTLPFFIKKGR